jgi:hypothetical protein
VLRYRDHLRTSIADLQQQITTTEQAATADAATREKNVQRLTQNATVVSTRIAEAQALLGTPTSTTPITEGGA